MTGLDFSGPDAVLAGQLLSALALAAHLLILRPRAARRDLLLDARIVQDELDLAARVGNISASSPETIAVHQLLRRIRQNPGSAELVLERIPALARATRDGSDPADVEYLTGTLDRLSDAGLRYLRSAWPRAGTLAESRPVTVLVADPLIEDELDDPFYDDFEEALDATFESRTDSCESRAGAGQDPGDAAAQITATADPAETNPASADPAETHPASADPAETHPAAGGYGRSDEDADLGADHPVGLVDEPAIEPDGTDSADRVPAWVDLVNAEIPRHTAGLGLADRHARPYRPARSVTGSTLRIPEQADRSSVLPR